MAQHPEKHKTILKFLEEDRGFVPWITMAFIPKEKRWSSIAEAERLSIKFVPEDESRKEVVNGMLCV